MSSSPAIQVDPDAGVADLRAKGEIRAGMGLVPTFAVADAASGELRGIAIELARALADRIGARMTPVTYPSPARLPDALAAGEWDIAFLGIDADRRRVMDFSTPYAEVDSTFLFSPGSPYRSLAELDTPAARIATTRNGVEDLTLTRIIGQARIQRVASVGDGLAELKAGTVDAVAIPRPAAISFARGLPGFRIWEGRYAVAFHAIAVPKGMSGRLGWVDGFVKDAKASGFIEETIARVGLEGAVVAPDEIPPD